MERLLSDKGKLRKTENKHALGAVGRRSTLLSLPSWSILWKHFLDYIWFFQHLLNTNPGRGEWSGQLSPSIHLEALWTQCLEQSWWDWLWLDPPWTSPLTTRTSRHSDSFCPEAVWLRSGYHVHKFCTSREIKFIYTILLSIQLNVHATGSTCFFFFIIFLHKVAPKGLNAIALDKISMQVSSVLYNS